MLRIVAMVHCCCSFRSPPRSTRFARGCFGTVFAAVGQGALKVTQVKRIPGASGLGDRGVAVSGNGQACGRVVGGVKDASAEVHAHARLSLGRHEVAYWFHCFVWILCSGSSPRYWARCCLLSSSVQLHTVVHGLSELLVKWLDPTARQMKNME